MEASYVGCFGSETWFENRTYVGGQRGARYRLAVRDAAKQKKRYFACARRDADGHGFLFDDLVPDARNAFPSGDLVAGGCERACADEGAKLWRLRRRGVHGRHGRRPAAPPAVGRLPHARSSLHKPLGTPAPDEDWHGDAWTRRMRLKRRRQRL